MTDILKDVSAIWLRLFDHKVFLRGEVQFTLREFEQKRNDIEVDNLFSLVEKIADINSAQINRVKESIDSTLSQTEGNLKEALSICDSISNLENLYEQNPSFELHRKTNKLEWEQFVDNMSNSCAHIDKTFEEKDQELKELYDDLQNKLNIAPSQ